MAAKNNENMKYVYEDAKAFSKITFKKYKKENGGLFDTKKEVKKSYRLYLLDLLPNTLLWLLKNSYKTDEQSVHIKEGCYAKLCDPEYVKFLNKRVEEEKIDNIKLLPIIIKDILQECNKVNAENAAKDPNYKPIKLDDMVELSQKILKKKIKKLVKKGVSPNVAFDVLSISPNATAIRESSQFFRIKSLFDCLYTHAQSNAIDVKTIVGEVIPEEYIPAVVTFCLLERKERFSKLTDAQRKLYVDISNWCFSTMEASKKDVLNQILTAYINGRRRDDVNGKDGNRRYSLTSLSEDEYPRIHGCVHEFIVKNAENEKYLA